MYKTFTKKKKMDTDMYSNIKLQKLKNYDENKTFSIHSINAGLYYTHRDVREYVDNNLKLKSQVIHVYLAIQISN